MHLIKSILSVAVVLTGLTGCASQPSDTTASLLAPVAVSSSAVAASSGGYVLSANELDYDCKQLTGRMQVRILEIRDYNERNKTSGVSRALQSAVTGVIGGTSAGRDPDGTFVKDRAMLQAYNQQLAAKGCKSYSLDDELKPKDFRVTPAPTVAPPAKAPTPKS